MSKQKNSKLDPFAERLDQWFTPKAKGGDGFTLAQAQEQLRLDGCSVSTSRLGDWWEQRQSQKAQAAILSDIATAGRMNKELDKAFAKNPAPEIERLIQVTKTLILSLQIQGRADPRLLSLATVMQQTVLNYLSGVTKAKLEDRKLGLQERRVKLLEQKAAAYDRAQEILNQAKSSKGGITPETWKKVEDELHLMP
jgi:hypothetical protein